MLRSCGGVNIWLDRICEVLGIGIGRGNRDTGEGRGPTESVHLNCPRNILVSEVVIRRVLFRRERR